MATTQTKDSSSENVVLAKFVQAFKMVNGSYQGQGRVGAAIIHENGRYRLLVYRDKKNHLSINLISKDFKFQILPKNYCTFYDKDDCIWSILFKELDELVEFAIEIVKCRWNSMNPPFSKNVVLSQQLTCPNVKKEAVSADDRVEVSYTVHSFEDSSSDAQDPREPQTAEIAVDSNWSRHLVGVELLSKLALVMDVTMLEKLRLPRPPMFVCKSAVIVKLTLLNISIEPPCPDIRDFVNTLPSLKHLMSNPFDPVGEPTLPVLPTLPILPPKPVLSVSERIGDSETDSVVLSDRSSRSSKAQRSHRAEVISRVARLGQPLPFNLPTPRTPRSDSDETEDDYLSSGSRASERQSGGSRTRNRTAHAAWNAPPSSGAIVATPATATQLPLQANSVVPPPYVVYSPTESQAQFNMFCSEVRTTNSELRMYLTRVYDKVEALANRFEGNEHSSNSNFTNVLERISSNEEQMKQMKGQLQETLCALKNSNTNSHGRSDGDREPGSAEEIKRLQDENAYLKSKSEAQTGALQNARIANRDQLTRIESLQNHLIELQAQFTELDNSFKGLQQEKVCVEGSVTKLQSVVREKQTSIDRLELALKRSEDNCVNEVRKSLREVMDPKVMVTEHVKKILNLVFKHVKSQFNPSKKYDALFVQSVLAETIRGVTLEYLQKCTDGRGSPSPPPQTRSLSAVTTATTTTANQRDKDNSSPVTGMSSDAVIVHMLTPKPTMMDCSDRSDKSPQPAFVPVKEESPESEPAEIEPPADTRQVLTESTETAQSASLPKMNLAEDRVNGIVKEEPEDNGEGSADRVPAFSETDSTMDQTLEENSAKSVNDSSPSNSAQKLPDSESNKEIKVIHVQNELACPSTQSLQLFDPSWERN